MVINVVWILLIQCNNTEMWKIENKNSPVIS